MPVPVILVGRLNANLAIRGHLLALYRGEQVSDSLLWSTKSSNEFEACQPGGAPGVYTNVNYLREWIAAQL